MEHIDYQTNRINLCEQIAEKLEQAILHIDPSAKEMLPSEQVLAKNFGVSRTVIREALKLLKERGLIKLRNGERSYVTKPPSDTVSNAVQRIVQMDNISVDDIFDMRVILEVAACRLAAQKATAEDLEELRQTLLVMQQRKMDLPVLVRMDADFHIAIAHASKNRLLGMFVETMTALLRDVIGKGVQVPGGNEDGLMRHSAILESIKTRDPDVAEAAIRDHLNVSRQNVRVIDEMAKSGDVSRQE